MEEVSALIGRMPSYGWGILAVAAAAAAGFLIWRGAFRARFRRRLLELVEKPHLADKLIHENYSPGDLLKLTGVLEKTAAANPEADLVRLTGADRIWLDAFNRSPKIKWMERILTHIPETGLFSVFLSSLKSRSCALKFEEWLKNNTDLLALRKVALSGRGEDFDGRKAAEILSGRMDQIREMAGDPEWASRYMALKILLYDEDPRSERALWEAFGDPHSLIRRTVIEEFRPDSRIAEGAGSARDRLYGELKRLLLDDVVFEVRRAAARRLRRDFPDLSVLEGELSTLQAHHLLEQLEPSADTDRNFAMGYLEGKNEELRLAAARFLARAGVLEKLFSDADLADRSSFDRSRQLLQNAAAVKEVSFLEVLKKSDTPLSVGSLLIAAEILGETGPVDSIQALVKKAFQYGPVQSPAHKELFQKALYTAAHRGNDGSASLLAETLLAHRERPEVIVPILESLSGRQGFLLVPALLRLLEDPGFSEREVLHGALLKYDASLYLDRLIDIISGEREDFAHEVRISAFKVLGMLGLPYCFQTILEHMPILPLDEARDFAVHMAKHDGGEFEKRVMDILQGTDGKVRASVIAAIPATSNKNFIRPIRESLGDADPEVRSAAVWALLEYGDSRSIREVREMLRDPVEKVRREVSRALAEYGSVADLKYFKELCADENEVESVKLAAIEGLRFSKHPEAVAILAGYLKNELSPALERSVVEALSAKNDKKELAELIEQLKDADHELRPKIIRAFELMGLEAEGLLVELLREDIVSLRPYITSVLEETGYIDFTIRKLSHRDPSVRREAAELLSLIGTAAAFRGIVLASRDPDQEVRVMVTRALERLNTKEGKEILEKLQEDPDRKIRKYTLWALERIKAKNA